MYERNKITQMNDDTLDSLQLELQEIIKEVTRKSVELHEIEKRKAQLKNIIREEKQHLKELDDVLLNSSLSSKASNEEDFRKSTVKYVNDFNGSITDEIEDQENYDEKDSDDVTDKDWVETEEFKSYTYFCDICEEQFPNAVLLEAHTKIHSKESKYYKCDECKMTFKVKKKYKSHLQNHILSTTNLCSYCGLGFNSVKILNLHIANHEIPSKTTESKLSCSMCERFYLKQKYLQFHMSQIHNKDFSHKCQHCQDVFQSAEELTKHVTVHDNQCPICERKFTFKSRLKTHLQTCHKDRNMEMKCDHCDMEFRDMLGFAEHAIDHLEERPCYCIICKKTFKHSRTLVPHIRLHSGQKPFECDECSKAFRTQGELNQHKNRTHNPDGWNPNRCYICGKTFDTKPLLRLHKQTHIGEKPFSCQYCSKAFANNSELKKHITLHTGEKKYQCDTCGRQFRFGKLLKIHLPVHTGERSYSCEKCGKCFSRYSGLAAHKKSHLEVGAYQCEICSKLFKLQTALVRHMRIHTGDKPYKCEVCNKAFNQKGNLTIHFRTHSREKPYKCGICNKAFMYSGLYNDHVKTHQQQLAQTVQYNYTQISNYYTV